MEPIVDIYVPPRGAGVEDKGSRHYCPTVSGASWSETAHGCSTASFTVEDPVAAAELTVDCPVVISDPRSGAVLWTGNVANDGVQVNAFGSHAQVRCVGNTDHLYRSYWSLPYMVYDTYPDWSEEDIKYGSHANFETNIAPRPHDPPNTSLLATLDEGKGAYPGFQARAMYKGHLGSHMWIGAFSGFFDANEDAPNWWQTIWLGDQFWDNRLIRRQWGSISWYTTTATSEPEWPLPPTPSAADPTTDGENYLVAVSSWEPPDGAPGFVADHARWSGIQNIRILGQRVDVFGANVTMARSGGVRSDDVVADLVGRCLRGVVDPRLTDIAVTSYEIDSADYRDPVSPGEILEDLMKFHPDHIWRMGKVSPTSGLSSLEWRPWASTPRYVIDTGDGAEVDMDGGPEDLYNRVTVRWTDRRGRTKSRTFTANPMDYPDIATIHGVREMEPIDLGDTIVSSRDINQIGQQMLDQVARRQPTGSVTVTRPVLDLTTQLLVRPQDIEAGSTVALTSDEPQRVHRVQEVSHEGLDVATLSLGRPALTLDQIIDRRGRRRNR